MGRARIVWLMEAVYHHPQGSKDQAKNAAVTAKSDPQWGLRVPNLLAWGGVQCLCLSGCRRGIHKIPSAQGFPAEHLSVHIHALYHLWSQLYAIGEERCGIACLRLAVFLCSPMMQMLSALAERPPFRQTAEFNYQ